jgi:hypothetical protein
LFDLRQLVLFLMSASRQQLYRMVRSDWPIPATHSLHLLSGDMRHAAQATTAYAMVPVHGASQRDAWQAIILVLEAVGLAHVASSFLTDPMRATWMFFAVIIHSRCKQFHNRRHQLYQRIEYSPF